LFRLGDKKPQRLTVTEREVRFDGLVQMSLAGDQALDAQQQNCRKGRLLYLSLESMSCSSRGTEVVRFVSPSTPKE
jgi:hypothetical protein